MNWSDGYVTEVGYTQGYYREFSPLHLDLALLSKGLARAAGGRLRYCELGFGQGLSLNIHAAANDGEFWGTDFSAQQCVNAADLASAGQNGARILNDSFADFAARTDLPEFDIIGLHGIWSWVSPEGRASIIDIVGRRLAPGGIVYVSYNSLPGWAPALPLQHVLSLYNDGMRGQPLQARITGSLELLQKIADAGSRYFTLNPQLDARLKDIKSKDWRYVAHEYFNAHWHPAPFAEVSGQFASARCDFAASASIMDHMEGANMQAAGQQLLASLDNVVLRETARDFLVNQQFRRDIFIKGGRTLGPAERNRRFSETRIALTTLPSTIKLEATTPLGKIQLRSDLYLPVIEALCEDGLAPKSIGELSRMRSLASVSVNEIVEVLLTLVGLGATAVAKNPTSTERERTRTLNKAIRQRSVVADDHAFLASPVLGGGAFVPRSHQLFQVAESTGATSDNEVVAAATHLARGENYFRPAASQDASLATIHAALEADLKTYRDQQPLYRSLGVDA